MRASLMRKLTSLFLILILLLSYGMPVYALNGSAKKSQWDENALEWIKAHKNKPLILGLDPLTGIDYFKDGNVPLGYLMPFLKLVEKDTGLKVQVKDDYSWTSVMSGIRNGQLDIVFGANETVERDAYMAFTKPIHQYPYAIYSKAEGDVQTIGDLDGKMVGFLDGDLMSEQFDLIYKNIHIRKYKYSNQTDGLKAVLNGSVAAFVTADGGITRSFTHDYPQIVSIANVRTFTSDMTLSMRKEDQVFVRIIDQIIDTHKREIESYIRQAEQAYTIRMLKFSDSERRWLASSPVIRVGAPTDYLPFDYYISGNYEGIAGNLLTEMCNGVGIRLVVVEGPFDKLYDMMSKGQLDVLNMAKTPEREMNFNFTQPFSKEEDLIYGQRKSAYIQDIYELENKRIAVVKGYWHKDFLLKNLSKVTIIDTTDLKESLKLVSEGKADYLIENPTVAQYYIDGLGYSSILEKGHTSEDSFLYFGINKQLPQLTKILNKTLTVVNYNEIKSVALIEVPGQRNIMADKLTKALIVLGIALIGLMIFLIRVVQELIDQKAQRQVLEEREKLIYRDGLTGLLNRMYFNNLDQELSNKELPQALIISDLNGLKAVNDTYGHALGDHYILTYAGALVDAFPNAVHIRMGGDEFLVVLTKCHLEDLEAGLARLDAICEQRLINTGHGSQITAQAAYGWSFRKNYNQSVDALVAEADAMMYQHKASMKRRRSDWQ